MRETDLNENLLIITSSIPKMSEHRKNISERTIYFFKPTS